MAQYQSGKDIPPSLFDDLIKSGGFLSLTRTSEEVSVVGEFQDWMPEGLKELSTWKCIKIIGPMQHSLSVNLIISAGLLNSAWS